MKICISVADGSLIYQHPENDIEKIFSGLEWEEREGTRHTAGRFYQCVKEAEIDTDEAEILQGRIDDGELDGSVVWIEE